MRDFNRKDGKFRTDDLAVAAIDTPFRLEDFGRVVSFIIVAFGKGQDITGAELDTVSATFAAFFDNVDRALGNLNCFGIKRNAPEFHQSFSHSPVYEIGF
jgi:hypothetical protein